MLTISLHISTGKESIASYTSSVIPRIGEHIHLVDAPGVVVLVTDVCYQAHGTDRGNERVELQVTAANEAARQYIGRVAYQIA